VNLNPKAEPLPFEAEEAEPTTRHAMQSLERVKAGAPIAPAAPAPPKMMPPRPRSTVPAPRPAAAAPAAPDEPTNKSESRLSVRASRKQEIHRDVVPSDPPIRVGQEFARVGPYQIVCELASGGMASVYLTLHRSVEGFQKLCCVKRIHPHLASDRAFTEMFVDEAQIAARISHPYVCSVFSFGRSRDSHFIAMEFLRGEPLSSVSRRVARTPHLGDDPRFPLLAARVLANLAEGLHAAHTLRDDTGALLDVVHRDVTPQNLFVMYDGSVRVTDFGIAQARQRLHQTEGQRLKGKLSYIAPELMDKGKASPQVDVWGLGVVLWELLAGRRLFLGSSEGETVASVMSRTVKPPSDYRASVPIELDRIVLRALERDLQHRYRSARDLARDLERFLAAAGDAVPAMDVADWMAQVFPEGEARIQGLIELAARVSAATADETVQRVPSTRPTAESFHMFSVAPQADAASESRGAETVRPRMLASKPSIIITSDPPTRVDAKTPTSDSRPEPSMPVPFLLVQAADKSRPKRRSLAADWVPSARVAAIGGLALAVSALGFGVALPRWREAHASNVAPAKPVVAAVKSLPIATPAVQAAAPPARSVVEVQSLPVTGESSKKAGPRSRTTVPSASAATAPAPAATPSAKPPAPSATIMGDVLVTTPGGVAHVFSEGRNLGATPGRFSLSVGQHELVLRTADGVQRNVSVSVIAGSPKLVTVQLP